VPSPKPLILVLYEGREKSKEVASAMDGRGDAKVKPKSKVAAAAAGVHLIGFAFKEVVDCNVGCFKGLKPLALAKSIMKIEKVFMVVDSL
jgi:hypothetical protein